MDQIGQYRVIRLLGEGGMGKVYLGEERLSGRKVALKLLRQELGLAERQRARFLQEMAILTRLDHPNVVRCLSCIEHEGQLCMVMELLEGHTLRDELERRTQLSPAEVIALAAQIAAALSAAHESEPPIIHRDLKPENVMLLPDGRAKVMDFGIAKVKSDSTHSTQVMGTIAYMSPEQIDAQPVDARSDLYNLGLLCYEALAGAHPFASDSPRQLLNAQCTEPPPALDAQLRAELPNGFEPLLRELLEKRPSARPESAAVVSARLAALAAGAPTTASTRAPRPAPVPAPRARDAAQHSTAELIAPLEVVPARRRSAWLWVASALGLGTVAAAAYLASVLQDAAPPPALPASATAAAAPKTPVERVVLSPRRAAAASGAGDTPTTSVAGGPAPAPALAPVPRTATTHVKATPPPRPPPKQGTVSEPPSPKPSASPQRPQSAVAATATTERKPPDKTLAHAIARACHGQDIKSCFFESITLQNHGTFPLHWELALRFTGTRVEHFRITGKVSADLERLRFKDFRPEPVTAADVEPVKARIERCLDDKIRALVMPDNDAAGSVLLKWSDWDIYYADRQ